MKILKIKSLNINSLKGEFEVDFEKFLKDESVFDFLLLTDVSIALIRH